MYLPLSIETFNESSIEGSTLFQNAQLVLDGVHSAAHERGGVYFRVDTEIVEVRLRPVRVPPLHAEEAFDERALVFFGVRAVLSAERA